MNANNNPQQPLPTPAAGATIQIEMDPGITRPTTTTSTSDSFGVLRGRLMDGIRRVMLPPAATGTNSSAYSVFRQQPDGGPTPHLAMSLADSGGVLAHHRYVPYSSVTVQNQSPQVATSTASPTSAIPGVAPNLQESHPRTPPVHSHQHNEDPFYPISGGLQDDDLPSPTNRPQNANGTGGGMDDNQRDVETITDALAQHPEMRSFLIAVLKTLPFVGIVLLKLAYDNLHALLNLAFIGGIFLHTNLHLKKEISKKQQKSIKKLAFLLMVLSFGIFMKVVDDPYILDIVSMLSYRTAHTFHELLYYLITADLCIKCLTIGVKTIVTMLPERLVEFKGRGRIYLLIESVSQFYRCFLPVQPWAAYLLNNYEGYDKIFGTLLVVAYLFWKFQEVISAGKFLRDSYIKFRQNSNFGTTPTTAELEAVGNQCPICHETFNCPIALECGHVFCDLCIGAWFDRETTCPLCRRKITDDPRYRDGSTSFNVQFA